VGSTVAASEASTAGRAGEVPASRVGSTVAASGVSTVGGAGAGVVSAAGSGAVDYGRVLDELVAQGVTAVLAEEHADGVALYLAAQAKGVELSVATLGEPTRDAPASNVEFSGLRIPRQEMGSQAVEVLTALIEGTQAESQRLLPCDVVMGETLKARK
jgi:DNA-binding LacI/PurR family transcriptional regulator